MQKNKYNIISISHFFYPRVGGLENMAYGVLKHLASKGFKSIAIYGNSENKEFEADGFEWKSFNCIKVMRKAYPIFGIRYISYLFKLLKNNPEAVVLVYDRHLTSSLITAVISKVLNKSYILVSQTTSSNYFKNKLIETIANSLDKYVFKKVVDWAEYVVCVSEANKQFLIDNFNLDPDKGVVIFNSFDPAKTNGFNINKKRKIVVFATKFIPVKDPDTAAKAFLVLADLYPDWTFIFAGKGESILDSDENLPENLEYIKEFIPQKELFDLLSGSAIYVNSSINEGLSLGVVEAAALGNITVLSDAPSNLEVAEKLNLTDYTFERKDSYQLALAIERGMNTFEKANLTQKIANQAYTNFSSEIIFSNYLAFINQLNLGVNHDYSKAKKNSPKLFLTLGK